MTNGWMCGGQLPDTYTYILQLVWRGVVQVPLPRLRRRELLEVAGKPLLNGLVGVGKGAVAEGDPQRREALRRIIIQIREVAKFPSFGEAIDGAAGSGC